MKSPGPARHRPAKGDSRKAEWELRLYVAVQSPQSLAAFANLKKLCDDHLAGKYRIEIVDLLKTPQLSRDDEIVAVPTLVRKLPPPVRKIVGDLSDTMSALVGLQLRPAGTETRA